MQQKIQNKILAAIAIIGALNLAPFFVVSAASITAVPTATPFNAPQSFAVYAATTIVNDPGFADSPTDVDHQWGLLKSQFSNAWDISKGSYDVIVGVIDTGIDGTHQDLSAGQVGAGFNFLTNTAIPAGTDSDDNGHGTLVAGVIAATPNNFRGIAGAAFHATLMPLKALDSKGAGNSGDIARAIIWAADHGANIINMSLGGGGFSDDTTLSAAVTYAFNKGVVLVAAAGNDVATTGGNLDASPVYPICDDNGANMVIGVAATDSNDQKATFSNYGKNCVDVTAPGKRILSTINFDPQTHAAAPNSYAYASGTSLAAPFVSAEAALLKADFPAATNREIRNRIIKSADPIDIFNTNQCDLQSCAGLIGRGRINALKAFDNSVIATNFTDGELVQSKTTGQIFYISGGQKQQVSAFVINQRFFGQTAVQADQLDLDGFPDGPYALPKDGTIVKSLYDNTVYIISNSTKQPLTKQVFDTRGITPAQVAVVTVAEINSWITGKFAPPPEGTLVKTSGNPTVYWVVNGLLHPINYAFWRDRGLDIFPIIIIPTADLSSFAQGDPYIR